MAVWPVVGPSPLTKEKKGCSRFSWLLSQSSGALSRAISSGRDGRRARAARVRCHLPGDDVFQAEVENPGGTQSLNRVKFDSERMTFRHRHP